MHKRQFGIRLSSMLKFLERSVVIKAVQPCLAQQQVKFGRVLPHFYKPRERSVFKIDLSCPVRSRCKHIQKIHIRGFLRPKWLQRLHSLRKLAGKKIAEPQEILWLKGIRCVAQNTF